MTQALLLAAAGCVVYGLAAVLQAMAAARRTGVAALLHPLYLLGLVLDLGAFVLAYIALEHLPVFLVNAILAASIAVTVLAARVLMGARLRPVDGAAVVVVVAGSVLLAQASGHQAAAPPPSDFTTVIVIATAVLTLATILGWRFAPGWALAAISGVGFALVTIAARGAQGSESDIFAAWPLLLCLLVGAVIAALAQLRAFQRGGVGMVVSVANGVTVIAAALVGLLYLGDAVVAGRMWAFILGMALTLAGCIVLAFSPAMKVAA